MKHLVVNLAYRVADLGSRRGPEAGLALPVKALDADGSVLAEGATSADKPVVLALPDGIDLAFVRLTWPSGRAETQRVSFDGETQAAVTFSDSRIAPNEWSAWAIPKLNPRTPLALAGHDIDLTLERFDKVWLRLWKFNGGAWTREALQPEATFRNDAAWQLDLVLSPAAWLLQVGGSNVVWRFVALPGGGPARVLITPSDSTDPRSDTLKVIVTSFRSDAETLLEFLARDSMRAAGALAGSEALAKQLFAEKFNDPVSAVAGAYYLLRASAGELAPIRWYENLSAAFGWLPDTAVIHCVRLLREGNVESATRAEELFRRCVDSGWPVYSEGVVLLQEAAGALRGRDGARGQALIHRVQELGAAKAWAGAAASFYGRDPSTPSILQWVGMPGAPRRKRLDPALARSPDPQSKSRTTLNLVNSAVSRERPKVLTSRSSIDRSANEFVLGSIPVPQKSRI